MQKSLFVALSAFIVLSINSCKENTILPPDLVPDVDNVFTFFTDTVSVITHNVIQDSIITGGGHSGIYNATNAAYQQPIGHINDPVFGAMNAGAYFQMSVPAPEFRFKGPNTDIDSVVVTMKYINAYGDTGTTSVLQSFNLYQVDTNYSKDTSYYAFNLPSYNPAPLGTTNVDFRTIATDSPLVAGEKVAPQLRFKLDSWYGDSLKAQSYLPGGAYENFTSFLNWHKGFYVAPANTMGNTFGYFDIYNSQMKVYYRYTDTTKTPNVQDTTESTFTYNPTYCNRWAYMNRSYMPPASNYINAMPVQSSGDSVLFLETQPGAATQIEFPHLNTFGNAVINKAELVFTVVSPYTNYSDTNAFNIPGQLQVLREEDGVDLFIEDYALLGTAFVDGTRKEFESGGMIYQQYKLNITNTVQKAITEQDNDFRLKIMGRQDQGALGAGRAVMIGSGSSNQLLKPRLNIIFTKIN